MNKKFIAIIDNSGANLASVQAAFARLDISTFVTSDQQKILEADYIVLPGVGSAGYAMQKLNEQKLSHLIRQLKQPTLAICLGQQLLCTSSDEDQAQCLNIIPSRVIKLNNIRIIPHMGWNNLINIQQDDPLLNGITAQDNFYFVHSFAPEINPPYTLASCHYGMPFAAVIRKDNFYGVQFHPEKSGPAGIKLLKNFLSLVS